MRLAELAAKSLVLPVLLRLQRHNTAQRAAQKQLRKVAAAKLEQAAAARAAAQARIERAMARRSKADRKFVDMLLSQDNPARTLDDKCVRRKICLRRKIRCPVDIRFAVSAVV